MMITLVLVLLQLLFFPPVLAQARQLQSSVQASGPTVTIPQGTFIGTIETPPGARIVIEAFLGIRYALPPTGAQRYSPPTDVGTSSATFNASNYGDICIQGSVGDEDCLFLNVFRPSGTSQGQKLPVVVYIHGGGFFGGSGSSRNIGSMVGAPKAVKIIGVSINYRLGALGFLSAGVTARAGALNLGLRDQEHALEWIKANIRAFGGDPTKVTIMGDSAGGHSVGHHLQSPRSARLFHQAIMESGAATGHLCQPYGSALNAQQFQDFMKAVGINSSLSDEAVMSALRALPASTIEQASTQVFNSYDNSEHWAFQPVIDGPNGVIPSAPVDIWGSGKWNKVPILTGFCNDEGAPFVNSSISTSQQFTDFFTTLNPAWGPNDINRINSLYPDPLSDRNSPYPTEYSRITAAYGQFAYIAPVRHTAHFASGSGLAAFLYHVKLNSSVGEGTGHDCLGGYVEYDSDIVDFSPSQKSLALSVNAFWVSFIATGDPNKHANNGVASWPRYVEGSNSANKSFIATGDPNKHANNGVASWPRYVEGSNSANKSFIATGDPNKHANNGVASWPRYVEGSNSANKMVFGAWNDERAGGKNVGILVQNEVETEFLVQSQFWWSKTNLSES